MRARQALAATVLVGLAAIAACWWGTRATEEPPAASSTPARAATPPTSTRTTATDVTNAPSDRGGSRNSPRPRAQTHPDGEASSATGRGSEPASQPSTSTAATTAVAGKPASTAPADPNVSIRSVGRSGESGVGTLTVVVTDGDGRPLSGVRLEIQSSGPGANGATSGIDLGMEGKTVSRECAPGRVTLDLTAGDLHRVVVANVVAGEASEVTVRMVASKDVTVEGTGPVPDGAVVAEAPLEGARRKEHADSGVIRGRIVESDTEKPIPGVEVRINGAELRTTTGDDGNFRLEGVDPGPQQLVLSKDGFEYRIVDTSVVAEKEIVVDETLQHAATLRLNLTRRDGRAYVGRATLLVSQVIAPGVGYGTNHSISADEDGSAVFRQIVPGSYKVKVIAGRIASASVDVEVPIGATTLDLTLE